MSTISKEIFKQVKVNDKFIDKCNSIFNAKIDYIGKELSLKPGFYGNINKREIRKLSNDEILESKNALDFDFTIQSLIPIFDVMDNNYLCFDSRKKQFCIFNTIDEIASDYKDAIMDLIDLLG